MTNCTILFESDHDEIQMAGERGIYSLLDMHQDAFNRLEIPYMQFFTTFFQKILREWSPGLGSQTEEGKLSLSARGLI